MQSVLDLNPLPYVWDKNEKNTAKAWKKIKLVGNKGTYLSVSRDG